MANTWNGLTTDQEIQRTAQKIADMAKSGMDTSAQQQHYQNLTGQNYKTSQHNVDRTVQSIQDRTNQGLDTSKQTQYYKNITGQNYAAPVVQPQQQTYGQQGYIDQAQGYVNQLYDSQKQAELERLRANRDKAVGEINQQIANTKPEYQQKRNQADVVNAQNVQRLREAMASAGLTASGENVTAQTAANNQRLNDINSLNLQEQQTVNDYQRRITDLMNPANENALMASLEAERNKALYDAYTRADDTAYSRNRDTINDARYTNELTYNRGRDAVADNQWQQTFDQNKKVTEQEQAWRVYTYNNMSASEKAQLDWAKQQYGEDAAWRMYELEYNGEMNKSLAQAELNAYTSGFNGLGEGGEASPGPESYQKNLNAAMANYQIPADAVPYINWIIQRESSFNPSAQNKSSSAYGYGQFIDSTRAGMEKKYGISYSNPVNQIYLTYRYMIDRYGTPEKAVAAWKKQGWY